MLTRMLDDEDLSQLTDDLGLSLSNDSSLLTHTLESIVNHMSNYINALEAMDVLTSVDLDNVPNDTVDIIVSGSMKYVKSVLTEEEIQEILDSHLSIGLSSASAWYSVGNEALVKRRNFWSGLLTMLKTTMRVIGHILGFRAKQLKQGMNNIYRARKVLESIEHDVVKFDSSITKKWLELVDKSLNNLTKNNNKLSVYNLDLKSISNNVHKHDTYVVKLVADIDDIEIEPLPTPDISDVYKGVVYDILNTMNKVIKTGDSTMNSLKKLESSINRINDTISRAEGHGEVDKETIRVARDYLTGLNKLVSKNNIQLSVLGNVWSKFNFR